MIDIICMIPLTQGKFAVVDMNDFTLVMQYPWHAVRNKHRFYAKRWRREPDGSRTNQFMHQEIMGTREQIDHADGDGLNNRRSNLRRATNNQNQWNKEALHEDGWKGIRRTPGGRWVAQLAANGQRYYGGTWDTQEEAARAYDELAKTHHGEFALLNYTDEASQ